jgi:hypothetical protein
MIKSYTCFIHRPDKNAPNLLAVTCADVNRAMLHAERAASEWDDWRIIEVFEGERRVAVRERNAA